MTAYNGHPSWAFWNVALWIGNDQYLYTLARVCLRTTKTRRAAARAFLKEITPELGTSGAMLSVKTVVTATTPDGARFSLAAVTHAMKGLDA